MESLLKWSIAAQNGDTSKKPDPKALSELFGAPDDLTQMRAEMLVAFNSKDKEDRLEYLEKFEEHIENVDNANNIGEMWSTLEKLVMDSDEDVRALALSCIGTAVQNNEKSQLDFLQIQDGIEQVMNLTVSSNELVATKALFALSCSIAHCKPAYDRFVHHRGWSLIADLIQNHLDTESCSVKRKARVLSLIYSVALLLPNNEVYDHFEKLLIENKLQSYASSHSGIVSDKSQDILAILKENPRSPVKLLN